MLCNFVIVFVFVFVFVFVCVFVFVFVFTRASGRTHVSIICVQRRPMRQRMAPTHRCKSLIEQHRTDMCIPVFAQHIFRSSGFLRHHHFKHPSRPRVMRGALEVLAAARVSDPFNRRHPRSSKSWKYTSDVARMGYGRKEEIQPRDRAARKICTL